MLGSEWTVTMSYITFQQHPAIQVNGLSYMQVVAIPTPKISATSLLPIWSLIFWDYALVVDSQIVYVPLVMTMTFAQLFTYLGFCLHCTQQLHRELEPSRVVPRTKLNELDRYGLGFNPPALVNIFHTPDTNLLFLHEYGDTNKSYDWFSADGCNASSKPLYMCLAAIDPNYTNKFSAIKRILEEGISNTPGFPCNLQVIDSMPYAETQDPAIPCTGILREYNDPARVGGDASGAPNWAWEMPQFMTRAVQLATQVEPQGAIVSAFRTAIDISLCKQFDDPNATYCGDDDVAD
ncbi:hypothetical protein N7528_003765 [Penicillium herquei]|nr:hypothetical protein N7528_003765 [Penicillium herquei]